MQAERSRLLTHFDPRSCSADTSFGRWSRSSLRVARPFERQRRRRPARTGARLGRQAPAATWGVGCGRRAPVPPPISLSGPHERLVAPRPAAPQRPKVLPSLLRSGARETAAEGPVVAGLHADYELAPAEARREQPPGDAQRVPSAHLCRRLMPDRAAPCLSAVAVAHCGSASWRYAWGADVATSSAVLGVELNDVPNRKPLVELPN